MSASGKNALLAGRIAVLVLALGLSYMGGMLLHGDWGTQGRYGIIVFLIYLFICLVGAGMIIGVLAPKFWWLSVLAAWCVAMVCIQGMNQPRLPVAENVLVIVETGRRIHLISNTFPEGDVVFSAYNETGERHVLAIASAPADQNIWNMCGDPERMSGYKFTLPALEPGGGNTQASEERFKRHKLAPGRYIVFCLEKTPSGESHCEKGEIEDFLIKEKRPESDSRRSGSYFYVIMVVVSAGIALLGGGIGAWLVRWKRRS